MGGWFGMEMVGSFTAIAWMKPMRQLSQSSQGIESEANIPA